MERINYSVIIRTTGKAGEKYQILLAAIERLIPKPKEIIVVLPENYSLPPERLGWETFYYAPKGMVSQRLFGIQKCQTQYALICDDDLTFESDFIEKLYKPLQQGLGAISIGPLYSLLPAKGVNALACTIMATSVPTFFHKQDRYISVLRSSGYSYNRRLTSTRYYETQSAPWACFFADIEKLKSIKLEDEVWLDANGYAALDDQTMFYKAWLKGIKTIVVPNALYEHLDAKTSTQKCKPLVLYTFQYNRLVFWHRFIYQQKPIKTLSVICYTYRMLCECFYNLIKLIRGQINLNDCRIMLQGWHDGVVYIHSEEYAALPKIVVEDET